MDLVYDIDNNCSNLRELAIAMKPLHKRFGIDSKVGLSVTDILEEVNCFNKSLYRRDSRNKDKFIVRHWNNIIFYPSTHLSEEYTRIFTEEVKYYSAHPEKMPDRTRDEVMLQLGRHLRATEPEMFKRLMGDIKQSELSNRALVENIDINFEHANADLQDILLNAFHDSGQFRGLIREDKKVKEFMRDIADKEKRYILSNSLYTQGENEKTAFVLVIGDRRHLNKVREIIDDEQVGGGYSRKGRCFAMLPQDFLASCQAIYKRLSKLPDKTLSMQSELDALKLALDKATVEFEGVLQKDYCRMAVNERYRNWGIERNRY